MKVAIIGSGIIGSAIAYELSQVSGLSITLLDQSSPAFGSTGAALGVLMGAISHKTKGRGWKLRQASLERYETLIPELESLTGQSIPFNRQGIVKLRFPGDEIERWEKLAQVRASQGWDLEIWDSTQLSQSCPHVQNETVIGAVYSPHDRQVNPTILTQALVTAAQSKGVNCQFGVKVEEMISPPTDESENRSCTTLKTSTGTLEVDWLIITAGIGSTPLTASLAQEIDIRPVLGQALQLQLDSSLGKQNFQPVITGNDVHIVPSEYNQYWVGATLEFLNEIGEVEANAALLKKVKETAIAFCPDLANATIIRSWSGKRPRPEGRPAPIIERLPSYNNVLVATGHYRNGILLAPATAQIIREMILGKS
ncbi:MAG: NAD(P)/FAD-dependent oxidoreductase [Chroococcales cyanobacterium]